MTEKTKTDSDAVFYLTENEHFLYHDHYVFVEKICGDVFERYKQKSLLLFTLPVLYTSLNESIQKLIKWLQIF